MKQTLSVLGIFLADATVMLSLRAWWLNRTPSAEAILETQLNLRYERCRELQSRVTAENATVQAAGPIGDDHKKFENYEQLKLEVLTLDRMIKEANEWADQLAILKLLRLHQRNQILLWATAVGVFTVLSFILSVVQKPRSD